MIRFDLSSGCATCFVCDEPDFRWSINMTPRIPEEFSTRLIDWSHFVIMGSTMPPRDHPDEDDEDDDEEEDRVDEPPVVREPDED
jgi:hypothetical protein